ncbi:MAG: oligosaccharide flippase family protein [Halobacteriota archaeon]
MPVKDFGHRLFNTLYELIFKEKMTPETQQFFTGTSYVAIGILFGSLLTFVFNALGARILGPTNFGNLALVTTVSVIISIPMGMCLLGALKYGSGAQDDSVRSRIISTSSLQTALLTVGSVAIFLLFSAQLSNVFGISAELYLFAIAYGAIVTFFSLTINLLRMLFRIRTFALFSALQSVIVLAAFLIFISTNMRSWQAAVFSLYIGYAAIAAILVVYLRQYIKLQFDRFWSRKLLSYTIVTLPGLTAAAFMGVDRILINKFITTAAVGIYAAYYLSSITVAIALWSIFNVAFFPLASKSRDKLSIFRNINKAAPYLAAALLPSIVLLEFIIFILYGSQYHFSAELGLLFAFAATACFFYSCYSYLMASEGTSGAKVNALGTIIALAVIIGLNMILLPLIGISGAAVALIFAYLIAVLYLVSRWRVLGGASQKSS